MYNFVTSGKALRRSDTTGSHRHAMRRVITNVYHDSYCFFKNTIVSNTGQLEKN
jgi:hypothetical protein